MSCAAASVIALSGATSAFAAGDAGEGEKVFRKCMACHVADEEKNRVGPYLKGVVGRTPGTVENFNYSNAMTAYGEEHVWDEATLTTYLADPMNVVEGTKMAYPGLKDDQDIADVIAYLKQTAD